MKRKNVLFLMCLSALFMVSCGSSKSSGKEHNEVEEKLAEFAAEGTKIHGTTRTLRGKLTEHYEKRKSGDYMEIIGSSEGCKSTTVCRMAASNAASMEVARMMGESLRGSTMRDLGFKDATELPEEYNRFEAACISYFEQSIKGLFTESMATIQPRADGTNNYSIYYLIDRKEVAKCGENAIKKAVEDVKMHGEVQGAVMKNIDNVKEAFTK